MKTETELFESALDTTSVNGKKLREYINENYISNSVLGKIKAEIMELDYDTEYDDYDYNDMVHTEEIHKVCLENVLMIIDKYKAESEVSNETYS